MPAIGVLLAAFLVSCATAGGVTVVKGTPHAMVWVAKKVSHPFRHPKSIPADAKALVHRTVAE